MLSAQKGIDTAVQASFCSVLGFSARYFYLAEKNWALIGLKGTEKPCSQTKHVSLQTIEVIPDIRWHFPRSWLFGGIDSPHPHS